jgi:predicted Holliday junction resolvase-like endonuclease
MMIFVVLMLCSCAYALQAKNSKISEEFERSAKDYNKLLRWREVENAGMIYMDPESREAFMKSAEEIKKRGVTIADYRILTSECIPEKKTAEVVVEFDYYTLPSNRIKTLTYRQNWSYLDTEEKKGWQLKSGLPPFD